MKIKLGKIIKWFFLSVFGIWLCIVAAFIIFFPNCSGDSSKANYARSIPKDRLEKLFEQLTEIKLADDQRRQKYFEKYDVNLPGYISLSYEQAPRKIKDLEFSNLRISKWSSRLMLQGCFDDFLTMNVDGLYGQKKPKITLTWGEYKVGTEVLWER